MAAADPSTPKSLPNRSAETVEREAERRKRLAEALRANLRRRKAPSSKDAAGEGDAG